MTFLSPAYLFGLLGLIIPIAIHIWSKKEGRLIKVGSTQFFPEAESKQSSSLHLNEVWLLIVRLLLIATLVLILAEPMVDLQKTDGEKIALITPGIENNPRIVAIKDSLSNDGYQFKWLSEGFPELDEAIKPEDTTRYWQLLSSLADMENSQVVVICELKLKDLIGKRPNLTTSPAVIYVDSDTSQAFLVDAYKIDNNSFKVIKGLATQQSITFKNDLVADDLVFIQGDNLTLGGFEGQVSYHQDTIRIKFKVDKDYSDEAFFIKAAIRSIKTYTNWPLVITEQGDADWWVWLSNEDATSSPGHLLTVKLNEAQSELINYNTIEKRYELTKRLNEEVVIEENLAINLLKMLRENHFKQSQININKYDVRGIDEKQIQVKSKSVAPIEITRQAASPYLWWLLLVLFLGERLLSALRKQ